jgi:hypothetical protein
MRATWPARAAATDQAVAALAVGTARGVLRRAASAVRAAAGGTLRRDSALSSAGQRAGLEAGALRVGITGDLVATDQRATTVAIGSTAIADRFATGIGRGIALVAAAATGTRRRRTTAPAYLNAGPRSLGYRRTRALRSGERPSDASHQRADGTAQQRAARRAQADGLGQGIETSIVHRRTPPPARCVRTFPARYDTLSRSWVGIIGMFRRGTVAGWTAPVNKLACHF